MIFQNLSGMNTLLEVSGVSVSFDGFKAINNVSRNQLFNKAFDVWKLFEFVNIHIEINDLISNVVFADEHTLDYNDSTYFIDGKPATEYTVEQDYYFFVGDNRHGSLDSRNWGIIPHKYIIGTPILKYFSVNETYWQSHTFLEVLMNLDESINWDQVGKLVL